MLQEDNMMYEYNNLIGIKQKLISFNFELQNIRRKLESESPEDVYYAGSKEIEKAKENWETINVSELDNCINNITLSIRNLDNQINILKQMERFGMERDYHYL